MELIEKKTLAEVHFDLKVWANALSFYKEELNIFQKRLDEIASKNSGHGLDDVHIGIEQFQNRFIIQRNEVDELNHLINVCEDQVVESGKQHVRRLDDKACEEVFQLKERFLQFERLYKELKQDFYSFLSPRM